MLENNDIQGMRLFISGRRKGLEKALTILADMESSLKDQENALERYDKAQMHFRESDIGELLRQISGAIESGYIIPDTERVPNVQIYEDVILDNKKPMHPKLMVVPVEERGIELSGKASKWRQIRGSLVSSKRFVNKGNNYWWVTGKPLPKDEPHAVTVDPDTQ